MVLLSWEHNRKLLRQWGRRGLRSWSSGIATEMEICPGKYSAPHLQDDPWNLKNKSHPGPACMSSGSPVGTTQWEPLSFIYAIIVWWSFVHFPMMKTLWRVQIENFCHNTMTGRVLVYLSAWLMVGELMYQMGVHLGRTSKHWKAHPPIWGASPRHLTSSPSMGVLVGDLIRYKPTGFYN